jgi:hypothetical protein
MQHSEVSGGEDVACTNTKFAAKRRSPTDGAVAYWHRHRQRGGEAHAAGAAHAHAAASSSSSQRHVSLPTQEGPLRRGELIARQPGRGLVVAVNLVVVPSGYTYRRPKAPTHCSTALARFWVQLPAQAIERLRPSPIGRFSVSRLSRPSPTQGGRSPQPQRSDSHRSQRPQSRLPHPSHSSAPISSLLAAERARGPPTCHTATLVVLLVSAPRAPSLRAAIAGSFSVSRSGRLATGRNRRLRTYACPAYPTTCLAPRSHSPSSDTAAPRAAALVVASPTPLVVCAVLSHPALPPVTSGLHPYVCIQIYT